MTNFKYPLLTFSVAVLCLANCSHNYAPKNSQLHPEKMQPSRLREPRNRASLDRRVAMVEPDNTRLNKRDRDPDELTADQQKMNQLDTQITAHIRRELVSDAGLSMYAKNIKIITRDGQVTLKGPVKTVAEKNLVLAKAFEIAGQPAVTDQLQIAGE